MQFASQRVCTCTCPSLLANCTCSSESKCYLTASSMELGETFEELLKTVDDVADWLQEKGFSSDIIEAFKGMGHDLVEVLVSAVYM